ncbi:MAG: Fic family protein [Oscillospiraceae bacterium]|nr:Fic family protein [Oscillospiraceae bacterium]
MNNDPFKEYIKQTEPDKKYKGYAWSTAIGLQAVDGLKPSKQLLKTAIDNIEGNISIEDAEKRIESYYAINPQKTEEDRTEEADKVSVRIAAILSEKSFSFAPSEYIGIHKKLFSGIYKHAGKIRDYNITKKEWVLDGETVLYGNATELRETLEYDFAEEKKFSYRGLSIDEIIQHLAYFISRLWQIHVFGEGNTRTTAVFFIKYLRSLGFDATNDIFAENAWYFRNALVRANYTNLKNNIHETTVYLEAFIRNLLLNENNELKNRYLHIDNLFEAKNVAIDSKNKAIDDKNIAIETRIAGIKFNVQTKNSIVKLYTKVGFTDIFGRSDVSDICGISYSAAGNLISKMREHKLIEEVKGYGKGKYRFMALIDNAEKK